MVLRGWGLRTAVSLLASLTLGGGSLPRRAVPHAATTFTVNATGDASDLLPGDGGCDAGSGVCTFRAAIEEANANAGAATVHFAIGSGQPTIAIGAPWLPPTRQAATHY